MKKSLFTLLLGLVAGVITAATTWHPSVSILGDSYSTFQNYLQPDTNAVWYRSTPPAGLTDVDNVNQTWWHQVLTDNGFRLCRNNSFSGSTICHTGYNGADYSDRSFLARMNNLGCPDIIFIFGATNDSWAGVPIGQFKYSEWTDEELYSFRPALACLLDFMILRYPNVEIHYLLNDGLKDEINFSVRSICDHYGIDLIELHDIDKINGHPSQKGMRQIATQITDHLKKINR